MQLTPGTSLGPYEVLAPIGAGGMGEVYHARDTRLGRSVAIKILPHHLARTPEIRARFEREAQAISSLNHPNICTLYDIGHTEGIDYLVLEHMEGETLADRLGRGPIPTEEVLRFGFQIADALDCAHRSGIIHRDLKPGNIMLTRSGAKLLDFGLARSVELMGDGDATAASPTVGRPLTSEGAIIGTFQYMAPEQLEGTQSDVRTDLWAFGVVLYEMATGRKAFQGKSQASLIAAIMSSQPAPIASFAPMAPPELEKIVRRCLEKVPDDRWQTARDIMHELRWLQGEQSGGNRTIDSGGSLTASSTPSARSAALPVPETGGGRRSSGRSGPSRRNIAVIGIAVALALGGFEIVRWLKPGPPRLNPNLTLRSVQVPLSAISYPGLSGDGKWIALPAGDENDKWDLYFMNASGGEVRKITDDPDFGATYANISPDGSQVVYSGNRLKQRGTQIRIVPSLGGSSRSISESGIGPHWSPDGQTIGYVVVPPDARSGSQEFWTVGASGANARLVFADTLGVAGGRLGFAWSPNGRDIAWIRTLRGTSVQELFVRELASGKERQLTADGKNIDEVEWTSRDEIIFSSNRSGSSNLWMIRASGGKPTQVTNGPGPDIGVRVSADGRTILYLQRQPSSHIWLGNLESGAAREITHDDMTVNDLSLSPDRSTIAAVVRDPDPIRFVSHILLMNRDGGERRRLATPENWITSAQWSPSGGRLAYAARPVPNNGETLSVFVMNPAAPAARQQVFSGGPSIAVFWIDERTLTVVDDRRSYEVSTSGGEPLYVSPDSTYVFPSFEPPWRFSIDIRASRRGLMLLRPGASGKGTEERRLLGLEYNILAIPRGGHHIFCWRETGKVVKVAIPEGTIEPVPGFFTGLTPGTSVSSSPDAKEVVYRQPTTASRLVLIENLH